MVSCLDQRSHSSHVSHVEDRFEEVRVPTVVSDVDIVPLIQLVGSDYPLTMSIALDVLRTDQGNIQDTVPYFQLK